MEVWFEAKLGILWAQNTVNCFFLKPLHGALLIFTPALIHSSEFGVVGGVAETSDIWLSSKPRVNGLKHTFWSQQRLTNLMTSWWTEPISPHSARVLTTGLRRCIRKQLQRISRKKEKLVQQCHLLVFLVCFSYINPWPQRSWINPQKVKLFLCVIQNYRQHNTITVNALSLLIRFCAVSVACKRPSSLLLARPPSPRDPSLQRLTQVPRRSFTPLTTTLSLNLRQTILFCGGRKKNSACQRT